MTAATGEQLTVYVSDSYTPDQNPPQQWADFFAGLIHGSELTSLTAYVATPAEVQELCRSGEALGCYGSNRLRVSGETFDGVSPEEVARHEYGHHVAANRNYAPWPAIDWGTKRWATDENVCSRAGRSEVFPGDEGEDYTRNPGEAFAETYRVLNDVRSLGLAASWGLVDSSFVPNAAALDAVEQDVLHPWTGPTSIVLRGRFTARSSSVWAKTFATPLDGGLSVGLSFSAVERCASVSLAEAIPTGSLSALRDLEESRHETR